MSGGKKPWPGKGSSNNRGKFDKKKGKDGNNKMRGECMYLSPCFVDSSSADPVAGKSSDAHLKQRVEDAAYVHDWLMRLVNLIDHEELTKLLNEPRRRCIAADLTDTLSKLRSQLEDVRGKRLPEVHKKHVQYLELLDYAEITQGLRTPFGQASTRKPVEVESGDLADLGDRLTELFLADDLTYDGPLKLSRIMAFSNLALRQRAKAHLASSDVTCKDPAPAFSKLMYSPASRFFFAEYPCEMEDDPEKDAVVVKFRILQGQPVDVQVASMESDDDGRDIVSLIGSNPGGWPAVLEFLERSSSSHLTPPRASSPSASDEAVAALLGGGGTKSKKKPARRSSPSPKKAKAKPEKAKPEKTSKPSKPSKAVKKAGKSSPTKKKPVKRGG